MSKIITFTGGIGAQLFSAAAYFHLEQSGEPVSAALGYFDRPPHLATPGVPGEISHWGWDLHHFGLPKTSFRSGSQGELIPDGAEKIRLGMQGFANPAVTARFAIAPVVQTQREQMFGSEPYACLHIRRGDYVNVATYVVDDEALFRAISRVSRLVKNLLVVSDSPLSPRMVGLLQTLPLNMVAAVGGEPFVIHGLMRMSTVLVCSNSQFSLSAAAMRDAFSLTLYPARHDGDPHSYSNAFLASIREFQVLTQP